MRRLSPAELADVEDVVLDHITEALSMRNADGTLGRLLTELGVLDLVNEALGSSSGLHTWPEGKILVVGARQKMEKNLRGAAKGLGISPDRLVFVTYEGTTNYDFEKLAYTPRYCSILFGCAPHSARGKGDDPSIISHIERHRERFAECRRLWAGGALGVTMTNFKSALTDLMDEGLVIAA